MSGAPDADDGDEQLDEATLLARLRTGDERLFRQVVQQLHPGLLRLARTYTQSEAAAQDAVQDTWLTVVDRLDSFEGRSSFKTWVCGILVHTARRSGVRDVRTLPFSSAWRDDRGPAVDPARFSGAGTWSDPPVRWDQVPEERLAGKELRRVIDEAVAALPARQREVMTARDLLGLDAADVAGTLHLSPGNQRVLLHRARSKVRAALEEYAAGSLAAPDDPHPPPARPRRTGGPRS